MKRNERAVTKSTEINQILDTCDCCHLALTDEKAPYLVTLNYGYEWKGEELHLYFHCASEGKKLDLIKCNSNAGFEMDCEHGLVEGKKACGYSFRFASMVGNGVIEILDGCEDKEHGLRMIMKHMAGEKEFVFDEKMIQITTVLRMKCECFTCKKWV